MDMARSLLKGRNLPGEFWGEAVRHAVYLLNRLPTKALPDVTPYEAWFDKKPNLEHLKVFGCVAFVKVVGGHLKKLEDRSKKMVYFGVEDGTKGYRLFDPESRKLRVSRDVVFYESQSWNWYKNKKEEDATPKTFTIIESDTGSDSPVRVPSSDSSEPSSSSPVPVPGSDSSEPVPAASFSPISSETDSPPNWFGPKGIRSLADIYNDAENVILEPGELLMIAADQPVNFEEAVTSKSWREAMQTELDAIVKNKTWQLVDLPPGHKAIGLKWVFKVKKDNLGNVLKHKARLVAKGYVQKQGIDFDEVFAPVARLDTIRLILALAAQHGWIVHHLDVKSAFLNGDLEEEVYVSQPEGYVDKVHSHKVLKLSKALYGLRQAPRAWNIRLDKSLKGLGFSKCSHDTAVYKKNSNGKTLLVGVYVDDLIVTGSNNEDIIEFKEQMEKEFEMSDLGLLSYYLGIEVSQTKWGISLRQTAYAKKILEQFGLLDCNPATSPMNLS